MLSPSLSRAQTPGAAGKPNILCIFVDDLNDWIGCYGGHPQAITPNIDRFAQGATLFERAYCPAPLCNPSRVSTLTGVRPSSTGLYTNSVNFRRPGESTIPDAVTLPQYLQKQGYKTFGGGKIFHWSEGEGSDPVSWDVQYAGEAPIHWPEGYKSKVPWPAGSYREKMWHWGALDERKEDSGDWQNAQKAAALFRQQHDQPFFIACGISKPHLPFFCPKEFFDMHPLEKIILPSVYQNDLKDLPPAGQAGASPEAHAAIVESGEWHHAVQSYLACTSYADACIGLVLDALRNSPYFENTMVVLWGDHGWSLGEKEHWAKVSLWEEGTRCPFIIRMPGQEQGVRCPRVVNSIDLYPTVVDVLGQPAVSQLQGRSIAPLLRDARTEWPYASLTTHYFGNHGVRSERWAYVRYVNGDEELYDMHNDPNQWFNLAEKAEYQPIKEELARWLPTTNINLGPEGAPAE